MKSASVTEPVSAALTAVSQSRSHPGSGNHIVWWVEKLYGKQQWLLTDKGKPRTDSRTLKDMFRDEEWANVDEQRVDYYNFLLNLANHKFILCP